MPTHAREPDSTLTQRAPTTVNTQAPPTGRAARPGGPTLQIWILCDAGQLVDILTTPEAARDAYEDHLTHIYGWSPSTRELGTLVTELIEVRLERPWCLAQYLDLVSTEPGARPDLRAHDESTRLDVPDLVASLRELLGTKLVAYIGAVRDTATVGQWATGDATPPADALQRLRAAHTIAAVLVESDSTAAAQAWMQGANPRLNDVSPARLLREGDLNDVYPRILAAARAHASQARVRHSVR